MISRLAFVSRIVVVLAALACLGCSGNDPVQPDPDVSFMVGDWAATRFVISPDAAPETELDLVQQGGTFTLNVQPSGQYTAALALPGVGSAPEVGILSVDGTELVFEKTSPPPATTTRASYQRPSDDRVVFTGPSELDVDGDGDADPVTLEVEIVREE